MGLAPSNASQPPIVTISVTAAEAIRSTMTTRRASWDDALRRLGCSMTTWSSSSAMTAATIALGASGLRHSPRGRNFVTYVRPSWRGCERADPRAGSLTRHRSRSGGGTVVGRDLRVGRDRRVERVVVGCRLLRVRRVLGDLGAGVLGRAAPGRLAPRRLAPGALAPRALLPVAAVRAVAEQARGARPARLGPGRV